MKVHYELDVSLDVPVVHGQSAHIEQIEAALTNKCYDADVLRKALDALILSAEVVQLRYGLKSSQYVQINDAIVRIRQVLSTGE